MIIGMVGTLCSGDVTGVTWEGVCQTRWSPGLLPEGEPSGDVGEPPQLRRLACLGGGETPRRGRPTGTGERGDLGSPGEPQRERGVRLRAAAGTQERPGQSGEVGERFPLWLAPTTRLLFRRRDGGVM